MYEIPIRKWPKTGLSLSAWRRDELAYWNNLTARHSQKRADKLYQIARNTRNPVDQRNAASWARRERVLRGIETP